MLWALSAIGWPSGAFAYRPFDGTDAAVADPGEVEVELGPLGYLREGSERTLIAPALTLNYGITQGWEAVVEGQGNQGLSTGNRRSSLVDNGVLLKGVLREGSLLGAHLCARQDLPCGGCDRNAEARHFRCHPAQADDLRQGTGGRSDQDRGQG